MLDSDAGLLAAPLGLLDQVPGLYEADRLTELLPALPTVTAREVADGNHCTIALSDRGADEVAAAVSAELAAV